MQIAMDAAKFSPDEANGLRRAMATFRKVGTIHNYEDMMVERMAARGYEKAFAQRCFDQVKGFGEYGFPESHAASFALLVYVSSWLKCHHPDVFCAALLNSQPMGFYAPAQIVRDAREHGVEVREADVNLSDWDNILEPSGLSARGCSSPEGDGPYACEHTHQRLAVRLGFRQIDGLREDEMETLMQVRGPGFRHPEDIRRRAGIPRRAMELLAAADAFRSMGLDRRAALWAARGEAAGKTLPLFAAADTAEQGSEAHTPLPEMPLSEHVLQDYQTTRLSLKEHPISFLRAHYRSLRTISTKEAVELRNGARVQTAGIVLVRQRPGSASGVCFITLEDETGIANLVVWPNVFERFRAVVMGARIMFVKGRVQRADNVTHIVAEQLIDRTDDLGLLSETTLSDPLRHALDRADEVVRPIPDRKGPEPRNLHTHPRNVRVIPKSRDFH